MPKIIGIDLGTTNSAVAVIRMNKNHLLDDLNGVTATRPSTAVVFEEKPNQVYRSISFNNQEKVKSFGYVKEYRFFTQE